MSRGTSFGSWEKSQVLIGAELDRLLEAGDVGATKTFLLLAVQTVDARLRFHHLLDDVTRPVRRVVVDKEKF